jgi:hypothetical protein
MSDFTSNRPVKAVLKYVEVKTKGKTDMKKMFAIM